jgi:LDH2 family malate/lactate/ureidoglycolate dehydrogenase
VNTTPLAGALIPGELVRAQTEAILRAWGMQEDFVATTATVMTHTDLSGIDSHGISMFINYEELKVRGLLNVEGRPVVVQESAATALIDAQAGLGHPATVAAMQLAMRKAADVGVGVVAVHNSHHFGAAGYYAALAAEQHQIGLVTTSGRTAGVVPTGAGVARLSTNPIAFAAPGGKHDPFILDMATSTVAINKIKVYDLNGRPLPEGWFVDAQGDPVTDARHAMTLVRSDDAGGLTPLGGAREAGGHKGYGLSMMVQILSSALSGGGSAVTRNPDAPDNIGHFAMAINPGFFRPHAEFESDVDELIDLMHASAPAESGGEVLVAGEPEARARQEREAHGVPMPNTLLTKLEAICERSGAEYLLPRADA